MEDSLPPDVQIPQARVTTADILQIAENAKNRVAQVRGLALAPGTQKIAPRFSASKLADLCNLDRNQFQYRLSKGELPQGSTQGGGRRTFTVAEARQWTRANLQAPRRPEGAKACTIAVANLKGGSTKTSTTMTLAQGLSLRGHTVQVIDLDPQGTLTQFFGILPDTEVEEDETVSPVCYGDETSLEYAVKADTYWDGIRLIPASPSLFGAEFALPARQVREPGFRFWDVINAGLDPIRHGVDIVLIDTSPSLSYLTINALFAADGIVVPLPPDNPAYSSLAQFWNLFADLANGIDKAAGSQKEFDFLHVLLSRVDIMKPATGVVRKWIAATYKEYLLPVEIPETAVAGTTALKYQTVFDVDKYSGSARTYQRAREAYDRVVQLVEESAALTWARTAAENRP